MKLHIHEGKDKQTTREQKTDRHINGPDRYKQTHKQEGKEKDIDM